MEQLKKLIEKWKAEAENENKKIIESKMKEGRLIHSGEFRRLKKCISEAEKILQETGEGREEAVKDCTTCKYGDMRVDIEPCFTCAYYHKWEPLP